MATVRFIAPQFLVDDLERAISHYVEVLGFVREFSYEGFYGAVSRDGAMIHLKCAPKPGGEREFRREEGHLDAFILVTGVDALHRQLTASGANIIQPLGDRPWSQRDFTVLDLDGYVLCFSEPIDEGPGS